jgi:hypothetical protein
MAREILVIEMQSRPEPFGRCYECRDGNCPQCVGVPCACHCETTTTPRPTPGRESEEHER